MRRSAPPRCLLTLLVLLLAALVLGGGVSGHADEQGSPTVRPYDPKQSW